ncbi:MAG TPA: HAMP domain-containing sensor histidine kinase [Geminicoccaceae bacterium]|nr:HAMP domain-containing sensor histidine kinase [Geminicoccaceae bacterium]
MRLSRLLRAAPFRLALVYAGLFSLSVLALGAILYFATTQLVENQLRTTVTAELHALQNELDREGPTALARAVSSRVADPAAQAFAYLLQDPAGRRLAGDLEPIAPDEAWRQLVPEPEESEDDEDEGERDWFLGKGVVLPDGQFLLVAHDAEQLQELEELLLRSFGWILAVAVPLALGGGVFMSLVTLRRIEAVNRVSDEIRRGDLSRRVPHAGTGDEFDRLAANINAMLDAIEHLTEGLRQVSTDIAHDLRTPLSRLRQALETARSKAQSPADLAAAVDDAILQADAILETFSALLRIAQIEAGTRRAGFAGVDLSDLFRSLVEVYEPVAEDASHRLEAQIEDRLSFRGDRELLTQMVANLIENAIRHTPSGSLIEVRLQPTGGKVRAVIADHGPGIPKGARDKVFRRFFRLEQSRTSPGSGLGLSLVSAIASLHGVQIELGDNSPGLRVTLHFPNSDIS